MDMYEHAYQIDYGASAAKVFPEHQLG